MAGDRPASVNVTPYPTVEQSGNLGGGMTNRATPEDFGSQVGGALEKTGNDVFDVAQKQQGMINETAMVDADAAFATKAGQIKADYTSKTGMAAYSSFPQYQADLQQAFQDTRANLNPAAQRGFDMMATRTMANHIVDGSTYATGQLKEANRDSYTQSALANIMAMKDPDVATNKDRSDWHIDSIKHAAQSQVDDSHPGLKIDPDTGIISFDESTPEGRQGKADLQQKTDIAVSQGYINKYDTLSKLNVFDAFGQYQQERDQMPRQAQVANDYSFAPKLFSAHTQAGTATALTQAAQDHSNMLFNPSASSSAIDWTMQHEGGFVSNDSGKGPTKYGINQEANPDVDVANLTKDQAAKIMHDKYWVGVGADNMSPQMGAVAFDTAVNMGIGKAKELVAQADGDPQKLIDLRRAEYNRLATSNPERYGQYLSGWNQRLNDLQSGLQMEGRAKTYGTNPDGTMLTQADYFRTHSQDVLAKGDAYAEQQMPGDLALKRSIRESLNNYMSKTISNQSQQYIQDNKNVMRAINGELTKGHPPETEQELRTIPGMDDLLNKVSAQDPRFAEGIPTMIAKVARRNDVTNSANGYDTILRALQPNDSDHPNKITHQSELDSLLGKSDGTGINMKDYNDAKPAVELPPEIKEPLLKHMTEITNANGNLDGKGQQRSLQWYNQVMTAYKNNEALGDKKDPNFSASIGAVSGAPIPPPPTPSRMTQIANWAKEITGLGQVLVTNPDGRQGYIPAGNVEKALKLGYTKVE